MKNFFRLALAMSFVAVSAGVGTAQTAATKTVMRQKLVHSQRVFEAIMSSNFAQLERESAALTDAAALHYIELTRSCFQCHRYIKDARIARAR